MSEHSRAPPHASRCSYEWVTTDKFNPKDPKHKAIKDGIEIGNSLPDITDGAAVREGGVWHLALSTNARVHVGRWVGVRLGGPRVRVRACTCVCGRRSLACVAQPSPRPPFVAAAPVFGCCCRAPRWQVIRALEGAGFEVILTRDLAETTEVPWYHPFEPKMSLSGFKSTPLGIKLTSIAVRIMEVGGGGGGGGSLGCHELGGQLCVRVCVDAGWCRGRMGARVRM
jgi:hypothetical protein